jgi:uncharacterized SAM-binding protein YcdF (DUF218 family)
MFDPIWLKGILKSLILPPTGPLLLALAGLLVQARFPRMGRTIAATGVMLLLVLSMPIVAESLLLVLDRSAALDLARGRTAQAIVVLGGGVRRNAVEYGGDTLGGLTLDRVRYGARVAKLLPLPVLVTGGSVSGGAAEAKLMREVLEQEFGVPVRWAEDQSRNTHENALYSARILHGAGIERIVLVAHSFDMPRAIAEFNVQGIDVIPAPTGIPSREDAVALDFLPGMGGLQGSYYAIYELLGLAYMRITTMR